MVDFFVRENPLLNMPSGSKKGPKYEGRDGESQFIPGMSSGESEHVLLDYGEFGFPDEQIVKEWTIVGCLTVILSTLGVLLGICVLAYTIWTVHREGKRHEASDAVIVASNTGSAGLKRAEVKAFSVDCKWNYPSAVCLTPCGRYLVTGGGPRMRLAEIESQVISKRKQEEEQGSLNSYEEAQEEMVQQPQRFLSYDSRPADLPNSVFMDYLNLGKNGKRVIEITEQRQKELLGEEERKEDDLSDLNLDDLLSVVNSSETPDLEKLHVRDTTNENMVWKKTRPSVESYPIAFWSMETMRPLAVYWNHEYPIVSLAMSPDGTKVVSADSGGNAILWSLDNLPGENGSLTPTWHFVNKMTPKMRVKQRLGRVHSIHSVTFTPSGRQFVLAATVDALDETGNPYSTCGALILWDIENWQEVIRRRGSGGLSENVDTYYQTFYPVGKFCDVKYTPNGKYLLAAAAGSNAGVYYFDNRTSNPAYGICMADLESDEQRPRNSSVGEFRPNLVQGVSHHDFPNADSVALAISPQNPNDKSDKNSFTVVSADNYGRIAYWDFAPRTNRPREGVKCVMFWSTRNSENTSRNIRQILYSPDSKYVLFLGDDFVFYSGKKPYDYLGVFKTLTKVDNEPYDYFLVSGLFTPDNKYFFGGGDDCRLRMWRMDELPMETRFMADHPGKKKEKSDGASEASTLEDIRKDFEKAGGSLAPTGKNSSDEEDDWDSEMEKEERSGPPHPRNE